MVKGKWEEEGRGEEERKEEKLDYNTTNSNTGEVYTGGVKSVSSRDPRYQKTRHPALIFENLTWLTSNEAADYLRLPSVGALRVLVCKRRVPFHKLGRSLRFKKSELDRLLEASRNGGF